MNLTLIICGVIVLWGILKIPPNIGCIGLIIQILFIILSVFSIMLGAGAITIEGA